MIDVFVADKLVKVEALDAELRAIVPALVGVSGGPSGAVAHLPDGTSVEIQEQVRAVILAHDPALPSPSEQKQQAQAAILVQIRNTAAGAAGKLLTDLTAAEVRSLMAVLLWKAGGVTNDGKVAALGDWA